MQVKVLFPQNIFKIHIMTTRKLFYIIVSMMLVLMLSSCFSSRKGRKSSKRYNRERCDCSRFTEMVSIDKMNTVDWVVHYGGQKGSE